MLLLALDTSTPAVTAAVADVVGIGYEVVEHTEVDARRHGELVAPTVDGVLRRAGVRPRDLEGVVVGLGPGPFTGLRVGIMTAATMADALGIPAYGQCSLDCVVDGWVADYAVVTDARRREVYWALYTESGLRIDGPHVGRPDVAAAELRQRGWGLAVGGGARVFGEGAHLYRDLFEEFGIDDERRYPSARTLLRQMELRLHGADGAPPPDVLTPLYLRRPDAVEPGARKPVTT